VKVPALLRRAGWNLADQVVSSGTNAGLSILIARSVDETAFGSFAVAFTVFGFLVGASRAVNTSPLGVRFTTTSRATFLDASGSAVGSALAIGILAGIVCAGAGIAIGDSTGAALVALGAVMPALLVQDAWRFVFFADGRPAAATLNDLAWAVVQLAAVSMLLFWDVATVAALVLAWGGAAAAAALLGLRQSRVLPKPQRCARWLREHRSLTGYLLLEFGTLQGCQQAALLLVSAFASLEAIGALRGGQVLLGPVTILQVAAISFAVPELSRRRRQLTERGWMRAAFAVSAVVTVLGLSWGTLFLLAPDVAGRALLGDTWEGTQAVLLPMIIGQLGGNLAHGTSAAYTGMDRAKISLRLSAVFGPLTVVGGLVGVWLGGAVGAAWGFAVPFWLLLPFWWLVLRREVRRTVALNRAGSAQPDSRQPDSTPGSAQPGSAQRSPAEPGSR
jgi:O-antigen/teichoic acid export membrane protein